MKINLQLFAKKTVTDDIVKAVINGKYGNGQARKTALANAGYDYSEVQAAVNAKLNGTSTTKKTTTTSSTTNKNNTATNSGFKPSATTDAYKNTVSQKEKELSALGKFTYDDYVQPDVVTEAFNKLNALQKPGEFKYGNQQILDDILNRLMNGEKFSYDVNGDALYQQYKDQFVNQGQLAMQDVMGQAEAMTGGYGNSYAQSVGQQTYQGYLQQLNDKIPELYNLALNKYNMDRQELKDQYGLLSDDKAFEYGLHRDAVDDYNTERAYLTDQARWMSDDAYDKYKTNQEQKFNEYSTEYGIISDALDRADENYWKSYGADFDTFTDARDHAYKVEQDKIANDLALKKLKETQRQFNIKNGVSSDGSSSGGITNTSGYDTHGYTTEEIKAIQKAAGIKQDGIWGKNTQAAYDKGIRPTSVEDDNSGKSDYSHAVDYAVSQGLSEAAAAGMMTKREWLRHGKPNGTYEAYVDAIIAKNTKKK
ncbi:MAG: hypothetical protein U0M60_19160 [Clostridia bacterium]|nr:hypothetical protein [Clostridia bacterium]